MNACAVNRRIDGARVQVTVLPIRRGTLNTNISDSELLQQDVPGKNGIGHSALGSRQSGLSSRHSAIGIQQSATATPKHDTDYTGVPSNSVSLLGWFTRMLRITRTHGAKRRQNARTSPVRESTKIGTAAKPL